MIVGLCGRAGSGKTTAAEALVARGFASISFAAPLKRMFAALDIAPSPRDDPRVWRETPHPLLCGNTPRQALQTLGTEWGRDCIGADFWVRIWAAEAANHAHVVADDVRFPNEAAAIRAAGGLVIRIDRAGAGSVSGNGHISETLPFAPDATIVNDGTEDQLAAGLRAAIAAALAGVDPRGTSRVGRSDPAITRAAIAPHAPTHGQPSALASASEAG